MSDIVVRTNEYIWGALRYNYRALPGHTVTRANSVVFIRMRQLLLAPMVHIVSVQSEELSLPAIRGDISGTVLVNKKPACRRLTLLDRASLMPVAVTFSNERTGKFGFRNMDKSKKYLIICDDHTAVFNVAYQDNVTPGGD